MSESVLERNVRLLLRRSYVPALPAPHYRDRLESLFLSEVERLRAGRRAPLARVPGAGRGDGPTQDHQAFAGASA